MIWDLNQAGARCHKQALGFAKLHSMPDSPTSTLPFLNMCKQESGASFRFWLSSSQRE